jgi:preprotein translocase subunit SecE
MTFTLYKPGQGYWTRTLSAVGVGTIVISGVAWLWSKLDALNSVNRIYIQAGVAVGILVVSALATYLVLNSPRVADFMIATEAEMKKVNWPTRREIVGSTWVVICGTVMMAVLLLGIDVAFGWLFTWMGVLEGGIH